MAQNIADVLAKFSPEDIAAFVEQYERENKSVAQANVILSGGKLDGREYDGKMRPEDERPENFRTVDAVREALFSFAATLSETIVMTPGEPGKNKNLSRDRQTLDIPTPHGELVVRLFHE